jgi:hypothetical protein
VCSSDLLAYPGSATENLAGRDFTQVIVYKQSSSCLVATRCLNKATLVWGLKCAKSYEVLRSEKGPNGRFDLIATTNACTGIFCDTKIQSNKSYWYRIRLVVNGVTYITKAVKV